MRPTFFALFGLMLPALAGAVPLELTHQMRVLDALGVPMEGTNDVDVALYDTPSGGTALWSDTISADFWDGFGTVTLGGGAVLDADVFDGSVRYLGMGMNGGPEMPTRIAVVSVPYAIRAGTAESADVADSVDWVDVAGVPAAVVDPLGDLGCTAGQIAAHDGTAWTCADHVHDAADISTGVLDIDRLPVGTSNGDVAAGDHVHAFGQITGQVSSAQLDFGTGAGQVADGNHGHTAADVGALPDTATAADVGALPDTTTVTDIGGFTPNMSQFTDSNGVWHTAVGGPLLHYQASRNCANDGSHLCRIADWAAVGDASTALAQDEIVWVDGIETTGCTGVAWTTGLRMRGWETGNSYTQLGPVACANRGTTQLRYRCCL